MCEVELLRSCPDPFTHLPELLENMKLRIFSEFQFFFWNITSIDKPKKARFKKICQILLADLVKITEYFSVFPKTLPDYFYRKEFPEN